jgi:SAM-dependent methyltransferase
MDALRRSHNNYKRQLIQKWTRPDMLALDCGCGRGGDWWKWQATGVRLAAIDPDHDSLDEAEKRAKDMGLNVWFLGQGDIRQAAFAGPFDLVCYNFSLHYIFENELVLEQSLKAIKVALKPGGLLIGITPEKDRALCLANEHGRFRDNLGNQFEIKNEKLWVRLMDGPFYADGAKEEPLLDGPILIQKLQTLGFKKLVWEPMVPRPTGLISDLYTKFVFVNGSQGKDELCSSAIGPSGPDGPTH